MMKIELEKILLAIFFGIMLFLGPGTLFDHKIRHDFPFAYGASDAFQHQVRAEAIKDAGNFRLEADYISKGFENAVGRYPPLLYHLAVILSYAAGIETYDAIYFIIVFFAVVASFIMYLVIRNFNKNIALISLPISLLLFSSPPATGFLWGHWPSVLSQSFLVLFFWSVMRLELKKSYFLVSISLSAIFLTHTSETVFALLFLVIFFGIKLVAKKLSVKDIKSMVASILIFLVISFYYIVIFQNSWAKSQPYEFTVRPIWDGNPGFYIAGFGLLLVFMIVGILFSIPKLREMQVSIILAFSMLISGFTNYIGFDVRAFQIRFFWPIFLSVFIGFGIYIILKFIVKNWNFIYTAAISFVLVASIGFVKLPDIKQTSVQVIPSIPNLNPLSSQGIMTQPHWEVLNWISDNTPTDSTAYFFYGDIYSQDALLRNTKRVHYLVEPEDFISALQERKVKREYVTEFPGDTGGILVTRNSFFGFSDLLENISQDFHLGTRDVCNFDYYVFDKASRNNVLAQYNLIIARDLLDGGFTPVFENDISVILKNENKGAGCIEERSF